MPAKEQNIQLHARNFKGLVLNPSVIGTEFNAATRCSNVEKLSSGQISVRPGTRNLYRVRLSGSNDYAAAFPFTYNYYDTDTGAVKEELLALVYELDPSFVQQTPYLVKLSKATLTITYVGSGTGTIAVTPFFSPSNVPNWKTVVTANGSTVMDTNYDTNYDGVSSSTHFGDWLGDIHALADFNCSPTSLSGNDQYVPIDLFASGYSVSLTNGQATTIEYYTGTDLGDGLTVPFSFTDANFVLPSAHNYNNVIYFATGNYELKYDGVDFYRSGLPQATINAIADSAGGTTHTLGNTYIYKLVYSRVDAKGNIIDGEDSDDTLAVATHTMVATRDIDLTINNLTASSYPNHAIKTAKVNGAQAGVTTITVDAGHSIEIGDTVYFYDGVSADYVTRTVTGTAATTITISGANVNVADNIFISNNIRIQIWRTKNDGTDFYFVDEIPNDGANATQVYLDDVPDTSLIEAYTGQFRKHSEPPKCNFIGEHQGLKIVAGDPDNPNTVYWALPDQPEAYPAESNSTVIRGGGLGNVTAFGTVDDNAIVVFKNRGHVLLDGDLDALNFIQINRANTGVGCTSFRSLAYIGDGAALAGLSLQGVFLFSGRTPELAVSENIKPLFDLSSVAADQVNGTNVPAGADTVWQTFLDSPIDSEIPYVLKRATAINDTYRDQYHLYLPGEVGTPGEFKVPIAATSRHLVFNYDQTKLYWTEYAYYNRYKNSSGIDAYQGQAPNAACGFTLYDNKVVMGTLNRFNIGELYSDIIEFTKGEDNSDYVESAFPVYLHIDYIPFVREPGSPTGFFKPLYVIMHKFLSYLLADPMRTVDFGSNFDVRITGITNFKNYSSNTPSTEVSKTFNVADGATAMATKCVTTKANAYQIKLDNDDALADGYVPPSFDAIEFVYSTPYDPKQKDPKAQNG